MNVVDEATDQMRMRLDASVHAQGAHFKQLLWHCLSHVSWLHYTCWIMTFLMSSYCC